MLPVAGPLPQANPQVSQLGPVLEPDRLPWHALDLAGVLRAQDELGLALLIELRVEHLVIKVGSV
jgi:hypothetical protein